MSLTVLTTNEDGECCSKRFWFKIKVKSCKRCEIIKLTNIKVDYKGSESIVLSPTIPHHTLYIYKWEFSDGSIYNTREINTYNNNSEWVNLTIWYAGEDDCCNFSYKRDLYQIDYFGKQTLSLYKNETLDKSVLTSSTASKDLSSLKTAKFFSLINTDKLKDTNTSSSIKSKINIKDQFTAAKDIAKEDGIPTDKLKEIFENKPPANILRSLE